MHRCNTYNNAKKFILILFLFILVACEPTGSKRCDSKPYWGAHFVIESNGYLLDCTPGFTNVDPKTGKSHRGWTDKSTMTVWIWETVDGRTLSDNALLKVMWHEAAHTEGIMDETKADRYAYCHMTPEQRMGVGFLYPGSWDC